MRAILENKLLRGSVFASLIKIGGLVFAYLFTLLISRFFGSSVLGVFSLCVSLLFACSILAKMGLDTACLRLVSERKSTKNEGEIRSIYKKVSGLVFLGSCIVSVVFFFLSPFLASSVFSKPHLVQIFRLTAFALIPFTFLFFHAELFRSVDKTKLFVFFRELAPYLLSCIFLLGFFFFFRASSLPIFSFYLAVFFCCIVAVILWLKYLKNLKPIKKSTISIPSLLFLAFPMFISASMLLINGWADTLMLGALASESDVGVYTVALRLAMLVSIPLYGVNAVVAHTFSKKKNDHKALKLSARRASRLSLLCSLPIFLVLLFFPNFFLSIFGLEFIVGSSALLVVLVGQVINSACGPAAFLLNMTGKEKQLQVVMAVGALLNIILNFILIPIWGIVGAAVASAASIIVWNVLSVLLIKKFYNFWIVYPSPS